MTYQFQLTGAHWQHLDVGIANRACTVVQGQSAPPAATITIQIQVLPNCGKSLQPVQIRYDSRRRRERQRRNARGGAKFASSVW